MTAVACGWWDWRLQKRGVVEVILVGLVSHIVAARARGNFFPHTTKHVPSTAVDGIKKHLLRQPVTSPNAHQLARSNKPLSAANDPAGAANDRPTTI